MTRKRYSPEQKVGILREHYEQNIPVADMCEKHRIHPNQFYRWKKELFEEAVEMFARKKTKHTDKAKIATLEDKLKERNEIIAELLEENLALKKANGEI